MKKTYLHPLGLRIWHWVNALIVIILLITGTQLRIEGMAALPAKNAALLVHRYAGWAMAAWFIFWLWYTLTTGHLKRQYGMRKGDLKGTLTQAKFYLFSMFKGEGNPFRPSPDRKFNPLQKLAYGAVMCIFAPVIVLTGVLLNDTLIFRKYILVWNVVGLLDAIHVIGAYVFLFYLIVHIYMATLGRTVYTHIREMIVGYGEEIGGAETEFIGKQNK